MLGRPARLWEGISDGGFFQGLAMRRGGGIWAADGSWSGERRGGGGAAGGRGRGRRRERAVRYGCARPWPRRQLLLSNCHKRSKPCARSARPWPCRPSPCRAATNLIHRSSSWTHPRSERPHLYISLDPSSRRRPFPAPRRSALRPGGDDRTLRPSRPGQTSQRKCRSQPFQ